jgi:hypothetical protein
MPYSIDLERDTDRGLDRYRITVSEGFDATAAHELGDWLSAAAQNPTAVFTIDVSGASRSSRPVRTLLARSAWLRTRRRVEVVRRGIAARTGGATAVAASGLLPLV